MEYDPDAVCEAEMAQKGLGERCCRVCRTGYPFEKGIVIRAGSKTDTGVLALCHVHATVMYRELSACINEIWKGRRVTFDLPRNQEARGTVRRVGGETLSIDTGDDYWLIRWGDVTLIEEPPVPSPLVDPHARIDFSDPEEAAEAYERLVTREKVPHPSDCKGRAEPCLKPAKEEPCQP